ncbi:Bromodomain containing protein [Tritrichomonas foetus]|uniref:Bromodomain containing protein n=1 Tax=Tritrichomonas foetus TaxID=1144522 RepID=A0A1J4L1M5_9EUKA|nr:Bromodomain containing protein [Tritrichomonas foetus]|eukprot:OHT15854.1 Bromodomain containing protein [Tritrichomonas foetus]
MKFTKKILEQAIKAMEKLIKRPISSLFHEPLKGVNVEQSGITNRIGLKTILNRLKEGFYHDTYLWLCDVETVFHNVELYYSDVSFEACMAREMRKLFNKERRFLMQYSSSLWTTNMHALRVKLVKYIHAAPSKLKSQIPQIAFAELPKPRQLKFTSHDIQCFQLASEMIENDTENEGLVRVINQSQPDAFQNVTPVSLNIGQLSDATLKSLKEYMSECLRKRNLSYPE